MGMSRDQFRAELEAVTKGAPRDGFFLEESRERELAYAIRSVDRWLDVLKIIEAKNLKGRCLDVGTSPFTFVLRAHFSEVHTLDYTAGFMERCIAAGVTLHVGGERWEENIAIPDGSLDCIIFLEVLEHMHVNPVKILSYFRAKLKPNGVLILSTPNMMCLGNRLRMLLNRRLDAFTYPAFSDNEHAAHGHKHDRVYMPAEIREYFRDSGWRDFQLGYHSIAVADRDPSASFVRRMLSAPIQVLKYFIPSLRQIMLVTATR